MGFYYATNTDNRINYGPVMASRDTEDREYKPLESIKDNFPKYILTRSDPIQHRSGIIHKNMPELMKNGELF